MDSLAQAYHWKWEDILRRTMPQILMLNHAASVNKARMDARIKRGRTEGYESLDDAAADAPVYNGKRLSELTTEEYQAYLGMPN